MIDFVIKMFSKNNLTLMHVYNLKNYKYIYYK